LHQISMIRNEHDQENISLTVTPPPCYPLRSLGRHHFPGFFFVINNAPFRSCRRTTTHSYTVNIVPRYSPVSMRYRSSMYHPWLSLVNVVSIRVQCGERSRATSPKYWRDATPLHSSSIHDTCLVCSVVELGGAYQCT
jgi:hypothetical protein